MRNTEATWYVGNLSIELFLLIFSFESLFQQTRADHNTTAVVATVVAMAPPKQWIRKRTVCIRQTTLHLLITSTSVYDQSRLRALTVYDGKT